MSLDTARRVLRIEAEALNELLHRLDASFEHAVDLLLACEGRVVVIGMGKSGLIGRKIAATFSSTGTPSVFLHPAEAVHGDLGMLMRDDVVLAVSYGGETEEITARHRIGKSRDVTEGENRPVPRLSRAWRSQAKNAHASRRQCRRSYQATDKIVAMREHDGRMGGEKAQRHQRHRAQRQAGAQRQGDRAPVQADQACRHEHGRPRRQQYSSIADCEDDQEIDLRLAHEELRQP